MNARRAFSPSRFDVIVVGGGIIGATLLNLLARQCPQLSLALIDAAPEPQGAPDLSHFDPRVVAISPASQSLFEGIEVWPELLATRVCPYRDMYVWDAEGTGHIHFNCRDIQRPALGHIIENSVLIAGLFRALQRAINTGAKVDCLGGVRVAEIDNTAASPALMLDNGQQITAPLVVAADGAHSRLRELQAVEVEPRDYGHSAIVTTVKTAKPHHFTARQRFAEDGPLAFLPLTQNGRDAQHCSIVWSLKHPRAEQIMALSDEDFRRTLGRTFEWSLGEIEHADPRFCFPLTERHARQYGRGGFVLVGDAAHTLHPLAGQGANLGLADVRVLAEEIQRAHARSIPLLDESLVKRYERRRRLHNTLAIAAMEGFKGLFGADEISLRWLRNSALRGVNAFPLLKNQLARLACD